MANNARELIQTYITELYSRLELVTDKFQSYKDKSKTLMTVNQITTGVSMATAGAGVATGVSLVGLPVAIPLGVISLISGATSITLTAIGRRWTNSALKNQKKIQLIQTAIVRLSAIIGLSFRQNVLKDDEIKEALEIYSEVLKKISQINVSEMENIKLESSLIEQPVISDALEQALKDYQK